MVLGGLDLIIKVKTMSGWVIPAGKNEERSIPDRGQSIGNSHVGAGVHEGKYESLKKGQHARARNQEHK